MSASRPQVLVYSDSLTWGIVPGTRERLPFTERWPGLLEQGLRDRGLDARILEDCLNGRRTVFEDPYLPGRNGLQGLAQKIEMHSPLALVVLMLGTNDFQSMHSYTAWHAAQGIATLVRTIREAPIEPGMPRPGVLVVAPPPIGEPRGAIAEKFRGAAEKSAGLAAAYRAVCAAIDCAFFDAGSVTPSSRVDGVHLDRDQHATLGRALTEVVASMLGESEIRRETQRGVPRAHTEEQFTFVVEEVLERVFPLFGAMRERDWAPGWNPRPIWPQQPSDRDGMVFQIDHPLGTATWVNTEFNSRDGRVSYAYLIPEVMVTRIRIQLEARGENTRVEVVYQRTALEGRADEKVRELAREDRCAGDDWARQIRGLLAARGS